MCQVCDCDRMRTKKILIMLNFLTTRKIFPNCPELGPGSGHTLSQLMSCLSHSVTCSELILFNHSFFICSCQLIMLLSISFLLRQGRFIPAEYCQQIRN